jgi:hypothetical protein
VQAASEIAAGPSQGKRKRWADSARQVEMHQDITCLPVRAFPGFHGAKQGKSEKSGKERSQHNFACCTPSYLMLQVRQRPLPLSSTQAKGN